MLMKIFFLSCHDLTYAILLLFIMNDHSGIMWRPPSLSELTPMILNMGLTHLGSEASMLQISCMLRYELWSRDTNW